MTTEMPLDGGGRTKFFAAAGSMVGQQVDTIGTQIIHCHASDYRTGESPEEKFRAAREYLRSGMPTRAKELIREAVEGGLFVSTEVAYWQALAVLGSSPVGHLDEEDRKVVWHAFTEADRHDPDGWSDAVGVIRSFAECLDAQWDRKGRVDQARLDQVFVDYERLPEERREEIWQNLVTLLAGLRQDRWDDLRAEEIRRHRMGNDRRRRVPLFFEPDPAPPVLRPVEVPRVRPLRRMLVIAGALLVGAGVALALGATARASLPTAGLVTLLWCGGGYVAARLGPEYLYRVGRRAAEERRLAAAAAGVAADRSDFADEVGRMVDRWFVTNPPVSDREAFAAATAGVRAALRDEIVALYSGAMSPVSAGQVEWLIRWHAEKTAREWENKTLFAFRDRLRMSPWAVLRLAAGVVALVVGAALGLAATARQNPGGAGGVTVLVGVGGWLLVRNGVAGYRERRQYTDDCLDHEQRYHEELAAYRTRREQLRDRPRDEEMARWLGYDRDHLRLTAMRRCRLTNNEVIAHFVLTRPAPGCRRARVFGGPPRCSAYRVRVFLLTRNGIRQVSWLLDFASGAVNDERRVAFRYDTIASTLITERDVHPHGRRQVATPEGGGPATATPQPVLRQSLRLSLLDGEPIEVAVNHGDLLPEELRHDSEALRQLEQDTSGVREALLILETVVAEGRGWIGQRVRWLRRPSPRP